MNIPEEAQKRYPHPPAVSTRRLFIEGAEWARREALREAAEKVSRLYAGSDTDTWGLGFIAGCDVSAGAIRAIAEGEQE